MTPSEAIEILRAAGMSEVVIAAAVDSNQSTINRIRHGGGTSFELGAKLVAMAEAVEAC